MRLDQLQGENGDIYRDVTLLGLILETWFFEMQEKSNYSTGIY